MKASDATLLDEFAAAALSGLVVGQEVKQPWEAEAAKLAYDFAQAMMDERNSRQSNEEPRHRKKEKAE
jgi:hypothetical protein